ncbi:MAG: hypothetical protein ACI4EI_13325 [Muricoprocola sp.]
MMILRMIEYDFAIALENAEKIEGAYKIWFPHSCILYLRGDDQKKTMGMTLLLPDGQEVQYQVPIIRMKWYSIEEILEKDLLMLLPFYIVRYETIEQQLETDEALREKMFQEYEKIEKYLEKKLLEEGKEKEFRDIKELISRIADYIFSKSERIRKGMKGIMGGQILELESDKLIKKAEEIGKADGKADGKAECILEVLKELGQISEELSAKISNEKNIDVLTRWFKAALKSDSIEEFQSKM